MERNKGRKECRYLRVMAEGRVLLRKKGDRETETERQEKERETGDRERKLELRKEGEIRVREEHGVGTNALITPRSNCDG